MRHQFTPYFAAACLFVLCPIAPCLADPPPSSRMLTYPYEGTWLPQAPPEPGRPPIIDFTVAKLSAPVANSNTSYLLTFRYRCGAKVCGVEKLRSSAANDVNLGFHFRMTARGASPERTAPGCLISIRFNTVWNSTTAQVAPDRLRLTVHPLAEDRACVEAIEPGFLVLSSGEVRREGVRRLRDGAVPRDY